jgi:hypothetical protein
MFFNSFRLQSGSMIFLLKFLESELPLLSYYFYYIPPSFLDSKLFIIIAITKVLNFSRKYVTILPAVSIISCIFFLL